LVRSDASRAAVLVIVRNSRSLSSIGLAGKPAWARRRVPQAHDSLPPFLTHPPPANYIYAGRVSGSHQYKLIRDGQVIKTATKELHNTDFAQAVTGQDFKWWFEHPTYTAKGYHGAQLSGGSWILGPDRSCSVSGTP
jgi:hypothetical protein